MAWWRRRSARSLTTSTTTPIPLRSIRVWATFEIREYDQQASPPATNVLATPLVSTRSLPAPIAAARAAVPTPLLVRPQGSAAAVTGDITIFAATSLTDVLTALGAAFTRDNPNAHLIFVFANSATLAGELEQGAKADVFASAHPTTMARVGRTVTMAGPTSSATLTTNVKA